MLPPKLTNARMLPAVISPGNAAHGQSPMMPEYVRHRRRAGRERIVHHRQFEAVVAVMKPGWNQIPPLRFILPVRIVRTQRTIG